MTNLVLWRKKTVLAILLMLLLAVVIRLVYLNELKTNPFFNYPLVDAKVYHDMALKIAAGESPTQEAFYQPPFYSYFLGFLYASVGTDLFIIRLLQLLLGVGTIWLTFLLARRFFSFWVSIGCGVLLAFYGPLLFYDGELLAPVLIVFFNVLLVLLLYAFFEKPTRWRALFCGLVIGLSAITMAVILPFAVVVLLYGYFYFKQKPVAVPDTKKTAKKTRPKNPKLLFTWRQLMGFTLLFGVGMAVAILPVTSYNWEKSHEFVPISTNAGINFYLGAGRNFEQKVAIRPGYPWNDLMREPLNAGYKTPSQQSSYYMNKALGILRDDPVGFMVGLTKKLFLFAHGNEIMRNQEIYPFRQYSHVLSFLLWKQGIAFPYGVLFPLAMVGLVGVLITRERSFYLILFMVVSHIVATIFFFVTARYRLNIIPFLLLLAVFGVKILLSLGRQKSWSRFGILSGVLSIFFVISNWQVGTMPTTFNGDAYYNLGVAYMQEKRPEAKAMFEQAIAQDSELYDAIGNLGIILDIEGDHQGAVNCFQKILSKYPDDIQAHSQIGMAYYNLGQVEQAIEHFKKVLQLDPLNREAQYNLSVLQQKLPQ